jgi:hypothetical protein
VRELARKLDWPHPRISHLLGGKRGGSELDVVSVLVACNAGREERERLLKLCRELGTQGWLQQYGSRLPEQTRTLVDHENKAVEIQELQLVLVPGLLQTESYARAVISRGVNAPESDIERFVHARLTRQRIFDRRPRATYFIHEHVLRLSFGGPEVMSDQLHNLLRMSVRPRLQLRIIPAAAGGHAGVAGSFTLLDSGKFTPVVYLESELSAVFLELPEQIAAYQRILSSLAEVALGHEESKELITALAAELYPGEDQHDGEHLAEEFL